MKLNIGCGPQWLPGYVNVDIEPPEVLIQWATQAGRPVPTLDLPDDTCFVQLDLSAPWPWQDATAEAILADNFLEHLTQPQLAHLLSESHRVLQPGGVMTGRVPDFAQVWAFYEHDHKWEHDPLATAGPYPRPAMNALQNMAHGWGHRQIFTAPMLQWWFEQAGFVAEVIPCETHGLRFTGKRVGDVD